MGLPLALTILLLATFGCGGSLPETPNVNLFDAIGESDNSAVQLHMDAGTDPNSYIPQGYPWAGASALHLAAVVGNTEVAQILIGSGANIDIAAEDQSGGSPLHWAIFFGRVSMTTFLVGNGADLKFKDRNGCDSWCVGLSHNPFIQQPNEIFKKDRDTILQFLKGRGLAQ